MSEGDDQYVLTIHWQGLVPYHKGFTMKMLYSGLKCTVFWTPNTFFVHFWHILAIKYLTDIYRITDMYILGSMQSPSVVTMNKRQKGPLRDI